MPLDYNLLGQQSAAEAKKVANQITTANRPTQITGEGQTSWTKDAQGNWVQTTALNPTLAGAQTAEQGTQKGIWRSGSRGRLCWC
jgi:hypothetical protein